MADERFDVLVVGAGPGGSIAALVLARGGARVALVDKSTFPRDKACGDLVGPRGVRLLDDLKVEVPAEARVGDMIVIGPTGRRVQLPCAPGLTYPGHAIAVPRASLDATLREVAVEAGAVPFVGQVVDPLCGASGVDGFALSDGRTLRADMLIGADGATSRVADAAGLVDHRRVMWGFAIRSYVDEVVDLPVIAFWEPRPWRALAGYGWLFPGRDGQANVGLGVGTLSQRAAGSTAVRLLPPFLEHLARLGLIGANASKADRLGGWLKMGMVGTTAAAGRVLLVGDAAGLVNPLQGEGIAQAMTSGRAAAEAILDQPSEAASRYRAWLASEHLPYQGIAASLQSLLLPHPVAVAGVGRLLTLPYLGQALAPGWAIFWNELLDGAPRSRGQVTAAAATRLGRVALRRKRTWKSLEDF